MNKLIYFFSITILFSCEMSSTKQEKYSYKNSQIGSTVTKLSASSPIFQLNEERDKNVENLNSLQDISNITVTYTQGTVQKYDKETKKFITLKNHDEISSNTEIQLQDNSFAILRNNDSKYINVKGPVARTETQNLFEFYSDKKEEESKSIWDKIYEVINYSTDEHYGEISGVTRGGIELTDENKSEFYFTNEAKVLKNNDALIFWQPVKNYNSNYQLRITYTDFANFKEKDTILSTRDTTLIIDKKTISRCNPCEIEIINPKNAYNSPKIEMYSDNLIDKNLSNQLKSLDSLIKGFPELKIYQYAKIQLLVKNEYFATAHLLFKDYIDEKDVNKVDYKIFLDAVYQNYSEK